MPLTRSQGISVIREFGRRRPNPAVPPLPPETVTIISVFPRPAFNKTLHFGFYEMPACPPCGDHGRAPCDKCDNYAKLVITATREGIDDPHVTDGSGRRISVIRAEDVAFALIAEGCEDRGVFVIKDLEPTHDELVAARANYATWAKRLVSEADTVWGQKRDAAWINPLAHDAAKYLNATRDWMSDTSQKVDCEACGERLRVGVILCKCGFPTNWQKAYDMGLLSDKLEKYATAKGLVRDAEAEEKAEAAAVDEVVEALPGGVIRDKKSGKFQKSA